VLLITDEFPDAQAIAYRGHKIKHGRLFLRTHQCYTIQSEADFLGRLLLNQVRRFAV